RTRKSYKRHIMSPVPAGSAWPEFRSPPLDSEEFAVLEAYRAHVAERAALGIPPLPLSKQQVTELVELLKNPPAGEEAFLVELLTYRVPAGDRKSTRLNSSHVKISYAVFCL